MTDGSGRPILLVAATDELGAERFGAIDQLCAAAFGQPFEQVWADIGPGLHVIAELGGEPIGHAMVVGRELEVGSRALRCGYVENVATAPRLHRRGIGSLVMGRIAALIAERYELGALATGTHAFYERLGWERWRGPSFVRTQAGAVPTERYDGHVMVLRVAATPHVSAEEPIIVGWRPGAIW